MADRSDMGSAYAADDGFTEEADQTPDRSSMTFLQHLDELLRRLIYSAYALLASCPVTF